LSSRRCLRIRRALSTGNRQSWRQGGGASWLPSSIGFWFRLGLRIPPKMRTLYVCRTLIRAERNYVPKPYPGTLVMFHRSDYEDDPNLGWTGWLPTLNITSLARAARTHAET